VWKYVAIWQSPLSPEVTPPAKSHHPQKPVASPVLGEVAVAAKVVCQFALP